VLISGSPSVTRASLGVHASSNWTGDRVEGKVKMVLDGEAWSYTTEDVETVW
jgi:hypothetical protein